MKVTLLNRLTCIKSATDLNEQIRLSAQRANTLKHYINNPRFTDIEKQTLIDNEAEERQTLNTLNENYRIIASTIKQSKPAQELTFT